MSYKCDICKSEKIEVFMKGVFDSSSTNVLECECCGLQFLYPRMSKLEESEYYSNYYKNQSNRHYKKNSLETIQSESSDFYEQYKDIFKKIIDQQDSENKIKKVLEIGSGAGGFLKFLKKEFPEKKVTAIDRDIVNVDFLKGCFPDDNIQTSIPKSETQDLIFAHGVLEHIRDGVDFIQYLKKYLNKKGVIVFVVPNKYNALVYKYKSKEFRKFAYMKQHYFTFSEESIKILANNVGMKVIEFQYINRYGLGNHLSWLRYGVPREYSDMEKCISISTLERYNEDLCINKISDLMMITLKK